MVVPFAPGGPTDACARLIAQMLSERTGQRFYIENVTGAGGNIGTGQAAKAQPDGYTVLITVNSHVMNPMLYDQVPYDPFRDFAPVTLASTVKGLVDLIKSGSVKYSFASPGAGTPSHLVGEQFRLSLGLDLVHVPFRGGGPAISSVVAGHTPLAFAGLSAAAPQANADKLRILTLMSRTRSSLLPDVPTIAEAGVPGYEATIWLGLMAPAATPRPILETLNNAVSKVLNAPDVKENWSKQGAVPMAMPIDEFGKFLREDVQKWAKLVKETGMKVD
jgi:tripartite-type tricarboxylate transporter receptor subunit TctC